MLYAMHTTIIGKMPEYTRHIKREGMRKIKEIMYKYGFDKNYTDKFSINEDFCEGFDSATRVIIRLLTDDYYDKKHSEPELKYYAAHKIVIDKIPECKYPINEHDINNVKEILRKYEFDDEYIETINETSCEGFETARKIIIEMLKKEYDYCEYNYCYNMEKEESPNILDDIER